MNKKITLSESIEALSTITDFPKRVSEAFLREMFSIISEELIAGESVKIKSLGTFKLITVEARKSINVNTGEEIEIPTHNKILFVPDKELSEAINAPFEGFETVELDENVDDKELLQLDSLESIDSKKESFISESTEENEDKEKINEESLLPPPLPQNVDAVENIEEEADKAIISSKEVEDDKNSEKAVAPAVEEPSLPEAAIEPEQSTDEIAEKVVEPLVANSEPENAEPENCKSPIPSTRDVLDAYEKRKEKANTDEEEIQSPDSYYGSDHFGKGFFYGFLSALAFFVIIMTILSFSFGFPVTINSPSAEAKDTVLVKDTVFVKPHEEVSKESTIPVKSIEKTDTIGNNKFLGAMARKHYGDYNFWVYIYEENKNIIENPNKIKVGTVVKIPAPEKYGIDKNNPESLKKAKEKSYIIFKKFE